MPQGKSQETVSRLFLCDIAFFIDKIKKLLVKNVIISKYVCLFGRKEITLQNGTFFLHR